MDFWTELSRFWTLLGSKAFWALSEEQRQGAIRALGFLYFKHPFTDDSDFRKGATALDSALQEYYMRDVLQTFRHVV